MAVTKRNLINQFGFTEYKGELLKYMSPDYLLIVKGNILYSAKTGCENTVNDKVVCVIDNFNEKEFANYLSKTINGYVKRYKRKNYEN